MTIILDRYTIPEQGAFEIRAAVQINVTAAQARRLANRFLMDEVSHLTGVFLERETHVAQIVQRAMTVAENLPPFVMRTEVPLGSIGGDL